MPGHFNFQYIAIHTLNYLNYNIKPATPKSTGFFNIRNSSLVYTFVNIHHASVLIKQNLLTLTQIILYYLSPLLFRKLTIPVLLRCQKILSVTDQCSQVQPT